MENQNHISSVSAPSKAELEQHLRARAWKDDAFRQELLADPKAVLERDYAQSFPEGKIPSELTIKVIEEEEQAICFVLPARSSDDQIEVLNEIEDKEFESATGAGAAGTTSYPRICFTCGLGCSTSVNCRASSNAFKGPRL